ncbi:hypothetical protein T492DRAFT_910543 [Pavlovales sp. CCMP2436]|nr:hypothetical protein T492DRAFT_910543 [Pavlovales sp. CCMP2436]
MPEITRQRQRIDTLDGAQVPGVLTELVTGLASSGAADCRERCRLVSYAAILHGATLLPALPSAARGIVRQLASVDNAMRDDMLRMLGSLAKHSAPGREAGEALLVPILAALSDAPAGSPLHSGTLLALHRVLADAPGLGATEGRHALRELLALELGAADAHGLRPPVEAFLPLLRAFDLAASHLADVELRDATRLALLALGGSPPPTPTAERAAAHALRAVADATSARLAAAAEAMAASPGFEATGAEAGARARLCVELSEFVLYELGGLRAARSSAASDLFDELASTFEQLGAMAGASLDSLVGKEAQRSAAPAPARAPLPSAAAYARAGFDPLQAWSPPKLASRWGLDFGAEEEVAEPLSGWAPPRPPAQPPAAAPRAPPPRPTPPSSALLAYQRAERARAASDALRAAARTDRATFVRVQRERQQQRANGGAGWEQTAREEGEWALSSFPSEVEVFVSQRPPPKVLPPLEATSHVLQLELSAYGLDRSDAQAGGAEHLRQMGASEHLRQVGAPADAPFDGVAEKVAERLPLPVQVVTLAPPWPMHTAHTLADTGHTPTDSAYTSTAYGQRPSSHSFKTGAGQSAPPPVQPQQQLQLQPQSQQQPQLQLQSQQQQQLQLQSQQQQQLQLQSQPQQQLQPLALADPLSAPFAAQLGAHFAADSDLLRAELFNAASAPQLGAQLAAAAAARLAEQARQSDTLRGGAEQRSGTLEGQAERGAKQAEAKAAAPVAVPLTVAATVTVPVGAAGTAGPSTDALSRRVRAALGARGEANGQDLLHSVTQLVQVRAAEIEVCQ